MTCEWLTQATEVERLRPEWDALWRTMPDRTPFQHSAWALAWWKAFGTGELRVLSIRRGGRLVGLLPMYCSPGRAGGELRLLGSGISDYMDLLAEPGATEAVLPAVGWALRECASDWTFCGFDHLRATSPLLTLDARDNQDARVAVDPCPALRLADRASGLAGTISTRLVSNIRNRTRRAEALGTLRVERADGACLQGLLEALFQLHGTRWRARGCPGVLGDAAVRAFHRIAAPALLRAGVLRVYGLWIGSQLAAVYYGFHTGARASFYIGGFDPAFSSVSAGKLVLAAAVEEAIREGAVVFDFLAGREPYKYEWGAVDQPRYSRHLRRPRPAVEGVA